jgi:hypothetical protein
LHLAGRIERVFEVYSRRLARQYAFSYDTKRFKVHVLKNGWNSGGQQNGKLLLRQKCKRTAAPIRRVYTLQTDVGSCTPSSRQDQKHNPDQEKLVKERLYARIPITNAPVD